MPAKSALHLFRLKGHDRFHSLTASSSVQAVNDLPEFILPRSGKEQDE
jgi:hypothetical protein